MPRYSPEEISGKGFSNTQLFISIFQPMFLKGNTSILRKDRSSSSSSCHAASTDFSDPLSLPSQSSIAPGWSSWLYPVSEQSSCRYVLAGRPTLARPSEEVHWSTSLMSSPLLFQHCTTCLVRLIWMIFVMGGRWPYSCCLVGCCLQILLNTARSILV